jgi:hypothetical protein
VLAIWKRPPILDQLAAEREAEAAAFLRHHRPSNLDEGQQRPLQVVWCHADAGVADLKEHTVADAGREPNAAAHGRELDRVRQDIDQGLLQADLIV